MSQVEAVSPGTGPNGRVRRWMIDRWPPPPGGSSGRGLAPVGQWGGWRGARRAFPWCSAASGGRSGRDSIRVPARLRVTLRQVTGRRARSPRRHRPCAGQRAGAARGKRPRGLGAGVGAPRRAGRAGPALPRRGRAREPRPGPSAGRRRPVGRALPSAAGAGGDGCGRSARRKAGPRPPLPGGLPAAPARRCPAVLGVSLTEAFPLPPPSLLQTNLKARKCRPRALLNGGLAPPPAGDWLRMPSAPGYVTSAIKCVGRGALGRGGEPRAGCSGSRAPGGGRGGQGPAA